jgi:type II secretory pathway predicted ATPase ExeA
MSDRKPALDLRSTFGFHATPFTREIAADHHFSLPFLEDALEALVHCVESRMSAALIAPAGCGKTALLRRLVARLPEARYQTRYVKVTDLSKRDMCREIAFACGAPAAGSYPSLVRRLQERFESVSQTDGLRPVLILDEAHELRPDVLAMLRLLTNFQMDSQLVLSLVLCGQPPLKTLLLRDDQEAIARRLLHYATLRPLSREELAQYVAHRCTIAGADAPFDQSALDALFEISRGNLRAADGLCLKSLERAALAKHKVAGSQDILAARKELWP